VGIAWDDSPEYFERVLLKLESRNVSFAITESPDEFRRWIEHSNYRFALLDIFHMDRPVRGQARPEGLNLCVALRQKHAEMPLILATDLYDTIDRKEQGKWNLGRSTYVWSKQLRPAWFAEDLVQLLERHGLLIESNSLLVLGMLSGDLRTQVEERLRPHGISATFWDQLPKGKGWEEVLADIQSYESFLIVTREGDRDPLALDIGRLMSIPRSKERLIVVCKEVEFPWLAPPRIEKDLRFAIAQDAHFTVSDELITRIRALMKPHEHI